MARVYTGFLEHGRKGSQSTLSVEDEDQGGEIRLMGDCILVAHGAVQTT